MVKFDQPASSASPLWRMQKCTGIQANNGQKPRRIWIPMIDPDPNPVPVQAILMFPIPVPFTNPHPHLHLPLIHPPNQRHKSKNEYKINSAFKKKEGKFQYRAYVFGSFQIRTKKILDFHISTFKFSKRFSTKDIGLKLHAAGTTGEFQKWPTCSLGVFHNKSLTHTHRERSFIFGWVFWDVLRWDHWLVLKCRMWDNIGQKCRSARLQNWVNPIVFLVLFFYVRQHRHPYQAFQFGTL